MITLDERLKACAEYVSGKGTVCDVGTDHAYLPAYLILSEKCRNAVAGDINDGPLEFAEQTLNKYKLSDKIKLVKSDGLKNISPENVSDVIIAGMGGETISDILAEAEWLRNGVNLILQPMTCAQGLRKWLYKNGYEIISERAVSHDRFNYTVINASYCGYRFNIGSVAENIGKINYSDKDGKLYVLKQIEKMQKIKSGLDMAGKSDEAYEFNKTAISLINILEGKMNKVSEIYNYIDNIAPFNTQSKWDNSGLITGSLNSSVSKVLVTLDITAECVDEADRIGAELVISHHPVIFHPLKRISEDEPSFRLMKNGISAICVHTPFDMAEGGMNDALIELLGFEKTDGILETERYGERPIGFGSFCIADTEYSSERLAEKLRDTFGCKIVKYNKCKKNIEKLAVCTGSGGDFIEKAALMGADGYITSEVHHDKWLLAERLDIAVFDCGHYHTENPGMIKLCKMLSADFLNIEFIMSETNKDPVEYVY